MHGFKCCLYLTISYRSASQESWMQLRIIIHYYLILTFSFVWLLWPNTNLMFSELTFPLFFRRPEVAKMRNPYKWILRKDDDQKDDKKGFKKRPTSPSQDEHIKKVIKLNVLLSLSGPGISCIPDQDCPKRGPHKQFSRPSTCLDIYKFLSMLVIFY